jgi:protein SCO1/2
MKRERASSPGIARCARIFALACTLSVATPACAYLTPEQGARDAGFAQRLSSVVPGALSFRDESGRAVTLADYFGDSPIIVVFAWYGCTTLCPTVVGNLAQALERSKLPADRYRVLVTSIDPRDAPADARRAKQRYLAGAHLDADAWHLLTGSEAAIAGFTRAIGFRYAYDDATHQYAHPAGIALLTPRGTIARYFFGFGFTPAGLREAVDAAAADEIAGPVDRLLLLCFHFTPAGRHSAAVVEALRAGGIALLVAALGFAGAMRRRGTAR